MPLADRFLATLARQIRQPRGLLGRLLGHMMSWEHRPVTRWALDLVGIETTDRVLDVGCGGGMAIEMASRRATTVVGLDYSPEMVAQSRRRNAAEIRAGRVDVLQGDVADMPFPDQDFDKVIAIETLYFWPDAPAGLREIHRVLRPGGRLALVLEASRESPNLEKVEKGAEAMDYELYSGAQIVDLLEEAGFARAWFETEAEKGRGWLCALADKGA